MLIGGINVPLAEILFVLGIIITISIPGAIAFFIWFILKNDRKKE